MVSGAQTLVSQYVENWIGYTKPAVFNELLDSENNQQWSS